MPLLRASDFCRIPPGASLAEPPRSPNGSTTIGGGKEDQRQRSTRTAAVDEGASTTKTTTIGVSATAEMSAVTVRLRLLSSAANNSIENGNSGSPTDGTDGVVQRSKIDRGKSMLAQPAVVYASSTKVLRDVALVVGSRAWLSLSRTGTELTVNGHLVNGNQKNVGAIRWIAVQVHLLSSRSTDTLKTAHARGSDDSILHISPLTALNLGWDFDCYGERKGDTTVLGKLAPPTSSSGNQVRNEHIADRVTLRFLGDSSSRPINLQHDKHGSQNDQQTWPLPAAGSILQVDTMISLMGTRDSDAQFFYHVVSVNGNSNPHYCALYTTTSHTNFRLESNAGIASLPRLPPLSRQASCWPVSSSQHPDIAALIRSWEYFATATPAQLIQHVIGTESDHHTVTAVQQAAELAGRACVVVPGLAAAAHLWDSGANENGDHRYTVSTGSLVDKLAGLQVALERALHHYAAPSILLLPKLHEELSRDAAQRQEEEGRIWSLLIHQLSSGCNESSTSLSSSLPHVPRVIVVLATDAPLPPGPFLQNLVLESMHMSLPNKAYIQYLWRQEKGIDSKTDAIVPDDAESDDDAVVQELLQGRPVREILELRHEWNWKKRNRGGEFSSEDVLREICLQFDEERRHKSCEGRIPSVHWEDVGGLSNVRREILNSIELPLNHPHLFGSSSSGRRTTSGILLYGAPGTGKTLVAKAVATECGLPFVSVKGPELLGSFVGESEAQVRAVFAQARTLASQNQPAACVLFFDELDSLAPRRGDHASGGNVMDRVVATLFTELDKKVAKDQSIVFCMGATNRPDLLDPALLRPGRLDRLVYLGISKADQANILATQMRHLRLTGDAVELANEIVPHLPPNLTGADLSTIATGGLLRATERLCSEADRQVLELQQEQQRRQSNSSLSKPNVSVEQVLMSWEAGHLEPVVTLDDLLSAARKVVPSVSAAELENYGRLGEKYRMA